MKMRVFSSLLATAVLAAALPEPAKTTQPLCSKLSPKCHKPAATYCSQQLGTATVTTGGGGGATEVTAFPSDYPCQNLQNARVKRAAAATTTSKVPVCLRKIVQSGGSTALTSACACYGIYPSTTTVTEGGAAATAYATQFAVQFSHTGTSDFAVEASKGTPGSSTTFNSNLQGAQLFKLSNDGKCNLQDDIGQFAFADPNAGTSNVVWYTPGDEPSDLDAITCGLSGDNKQNLECLSGSDLYNQEAASDGVTWQITNDYHAVFDLHVVPVAS